MRKYIFLTTIQTKVQTEQKVDFADETKVHFAMDKKVAFPAKTRLKHLMTQYCQCCLKGVNVLRIIKSKIRSVAQRKKYL